MKKSSFKHIRNFIRPYLIEAGRRRSTSESRLVVRVRYDFDRFQVDVPKYRGPVFLEHVPSQMPPDITGIALHGSRTGLLMDRIIRIGKRLGGQGTQKGRRVKHVVAIVAARDKKALHRIFDGATEAGVALRKKARVLVKNGSKNEIPEEGLRRRAGNRVAVARAVGIPTLAGSAGRIGGLVFRGA